MAAVPTRPRPAFPNVARATVLAPAKVNLVLGVGPLRPDGFHDLQTLFLAVDRFDRVSVCRGRLRDGSLVTTSGIAAHAVPRGMDNIAARAVAAALSAAGHPAATDHAWHVRITKRIPVAGGMAGGSTDGAAALRAANALFHLGLSTDRLLDLAADLGSDVPFTLIGGAAVGTGRGERLDPVTVAQPLHLVIVPSAGHLSTPVVYRTLDNLRASSSMPPPSAVSPELLALLSNPATSPAEIADHVTNDLGPATLSLQPVLGTTLDRLRTAGSLTAVVSGSGPTCFGLAADAAHARRIAAAIPGAFVASGPVGPGSVTLS